MSKVKYKVTIEPLTTVDGVGGSYDAHDVINQDIGKKLSGTADVTVDTAEHNTTGYSGGTVAYGNCPASGSTLTLGSSGYDFVYIKHTGYQWGGDTTTLGSTTTNNLVVTIGSQALCTIPPGGAIALPTVPAANLIVTSSSSQTIAVEYALIT